MTSIAIDRTDGLSSATAIKGPVRVATTANITLSGTQTIDGVSVAAGDRVLAKDQTTGNENGIYTADTGPWRRAKDFSGNRDVKKGTQILVTDGALSGGSGYYVSTADPIVIGTTSVAFTRNIVTSADASTLADNIADINTVAGISDDVSAVAAVADDVTAVAGIAANVTTVAGVADDIPTIADNIESVSNFSSVYQGAKAAAPTLRNDGTALQVGDLYFDTGSSKLLTYTGSAWIGGTGDMVSTNNGSDFADAPTARGNLGSIFETAAALTAHSFLPATAPASVIVERPYTGALFSPAIYKKVASIPTHDCYVLDADGTVYEYAEDTIHVPALFLSTDADDVSLALGRAVDLLIARGGNGTIKLPPTTDGTKYAWKTVVSKTFAGAWTFDRRGAVIKYDDEFMNDGTLAITNPLAIYGTAATDITSQISKAFPGYFVLSSAIAGLSAQKGARIGILDTNAGGADLEPASAAVTADASTNEITVAGTYRTAQPFRMTTSTTLPAPLATGTTYYAILSGSKIKVASSAAAANAGVAIDITDTGTGTHHIVEPPHNWGDFQPSTLAQVSMYDEANLRLDFAPELRHVVPVIAATANTTGELDATDMQVLVWTGDNDMTLLVGRDEGNYLPTGSVPSPVTGGQSAGGASVFGILHENGNVIVDGVTSDGICGHVLVRYGELTTINHRVDGPYNGNAVSAQAFTKTTLINPRYHAVRHASTGGGAYAGMSELEIHGGYIGQPHISFSANKMPAEENCALDNHGGNVSTKVFGTTIYGGFNWASGYNEFNDATLIASQTFGAIRVRDDGKSGSQLVYRGGRILMPRYREDNEEGTTGGGNFSSSDFKFLVEPPVANGLTDFEAVFDGVRFGVQDPRSWPSTMISAVFEFGNAVFSRVKFTRCHFDFRNSYIKQIIFNVRGDGGTVFEIADDNFFDGCGAYLMESSTLNKIRRPIFNRNRIFNDDPSAFNPFALRFGGDTTAASVTQVIEASDNIIETMGSSGGIHTEAVAMIGNIMPRNRVKYRGSSAVDLGYAIRARRNVNSTYTNFESDLSGSKVENDPSLSNNIVLGIQVLNHGLSGALPEAYYNLDGSTVSGATTKASLTGTSRKKETFVIPVGDETTAIATGTAKATFRMPTGFTVTGVRASLSTAQATSGAGGIVTVDINEAGTTILSTKLTIDNTEKTSTTAATAAVISDAALADDAEITIDIDQIGDGTAKGLKVYITGVRL